MSRDVDPMNPAEAFEQLRAEVALLRRAVEGLAAERNAQPDYGPTVEKLVERQDAVVAAARKMLASPALQLTPASFAADLAEASQAARQHDRVIVDDASRTLSQVARQLERAFAGAREACVQRDAIIWAVVLTMGGTAAALAASAALFG